ncbi:hypothetical protein CEE81_11395, partial [Lactobacillus crispatus]
SQERGLAAQAIGERRDQERPEHRADQPGREHRPEHRALDAERMRQHRRDIGDGLHIEAVDHDGERAQHEDADLEAAQPLAVDDPRYVDPAQRNHRRLDVHRSSLHAPAWRRS